MKIEWKDNSANVGRLELRVRQSEYTGKWGAVVWLRLNPMGSQDGFGSDAEARAWCEREAESILGTLLDAARAEIAALRAEIDEERRADYAPSSHGCMDNSCVVAKPTGMATNGGCRCGRATLKSALWRAREERDAARADGAASEREACALVVDAEIAALMAMGPERDERGTTVVGWRIKGLRVVRDAIRARSNSGARSGEEDAK